MKTKIAYYKDLDHTLHRVIIAASMFDLFVGSPGKYTPKQARELRNEGMRQAEGTRRLSLQPSF